MAAKNADKSSVICQGSALLKAIYVYISKRNAGQHQQLKGRLRLFGSSLFKSAHTPWKWHFRPRWPAVKQNAQFPFDATRHPKEHFAISRPPNPSVGFFWTTYNPSVDGFRSSQIAKTSGQVRRPRKREETTYLAEYLEIAVAQFFGGMIKYESRDYPTEHNRNFKALNPNNGLFYLYEVRNSRGFETMKCSIR